MKHNLIIGCSGIIIWLLSSCSDKLDGEPNVSFYNGNSLLPLIHFKTSENTEVLINYWNEGSPNKVLRSEVSMGDDHQIVLYNIKEKTNYQYQITDIDQNWKSEEFVFTSGEIPNEAFKVTKEKIDTSAFTGYILVRRLSQFGADAILNNKGEIVWYHLYDTMVRRAFTWTHKSTILSVYDSARIVEIDLKGNTILDLDLERLGVPNKLHHEIIYNRRGQIAALTLDSGEVDLTHFGGKNRQNLRADGIILLDSFGNKLWEWNLLDVARPLMSKLGVAHLNRSWGHANSFAIDKDGHYVISMKEFNQIWKVNSQDGSIIWRLGENGDFQMQPDDFFLGQHSIYFTSDGELMMFDNGNQGLRPNSRVLAFQLDETNMVATSVVKVNLPIDLSAYRMGSAEQIESGKYLVSTVRRGGVISVVNTSGAVIWKVALNNPSYRAYYIKNPFNQ